MKKIFKIASTLCILTLMGSALAACGSPNNSASSTNEPSNNSTSTEAAGKKDIPTLVWWQIGNTPLPANYSKAIDKMNEYTAEKIGVKVDLRVASWGEWDTKMNTIVNTGEPFDMMFTNNTKYSKQVAMGALTDITDLVQSEAPDLYKSIPSEVWDGTKIGGKYYAVPTYKDSSVSQYWSYDDKLVQKYNIDYQNITSMQDLDKPLHDIKAGEGKSFYPLRLIQSEAFSGMFNNYDDLTLGFFPVGVKVDDPSRKVISVFEQPDVMENLKLLHKWYQDGIINPDAPTKTEKEKYNPFGTQQAFPGAEIAMQINAGVEKFVMNKTFGPLYTTSTIQGSLNAISANSKYKNEALKYLQLVNTDSKLRNMLAFGEEGVDFKYVDGKDNVIERTSDTWPLAAYSQGTFFNMAITKGAPEDQWDQVKKLNEQAVASTVLGFALDISEIQTEVANAQSTFDKYKYELLTGASDPEKIVPKMLDELKKAGLDKIIQKAQEEIDNYFK